MALMYAAAKLPAKYGSSEKYSKFLPQSGERFMFTPGPRTTATPSAMASFAIVFAACAATARFQEAASAEAVGMQVAAFVDHLPSFITILRRPCGPSVIIAPGMPRRSTPCVCQEPSPSHRFAFSEVVILSNIASVGKCFILMLLIPMDIDFSLYIIKKAW